MGPMGDYLYGLWFAYSYVMNCLFIHKLPSLMSIIIIIKDFDLLVSQLFSEDSDLESLFYVTEYFTYSSVLLMFLLCLSR